MQYPRGIAKATRIQGHLNDLLLHVGCLPGVGICQEKRPPTIWARPAPIPLLTFRRHAMPDDIGPLTVWTMQHLGHHGTPTQSWWRSSSRRGYQINSSETPSAVLQWQEMAVSHGCLLDERGTDLGGNVPCSLPADTYRRLYRFIARSISPIS
jgi:hypothetical protein